MYAFETQNRPKGSGFGELEITNLSDSLLQLIWVELAFSDADGKWPTSGVDVAELEPE
jgi:hypothetical protein